MENTTKNLLIRSSEENINYFKEKGWEFFSNNKLFYAFTYKNYLINILLNIEIFFANEYKTIEFPDAEYLGFYKKRGTNKTVFVDKSQIATINFNLTQEQLDLYYKLMHTLYINEYSTESNYSVSHFFLYIIDFIKTKKNKLKLLLPLDDTA